MSELTEETEATPEVEKPTEATEAVGDVPPPPDITEAFIGAAEPGTDEARARVLGAEVVDPGDDSPEGAQPVNPEPVKRRGRKPKAGDITEAQQRAQAEVYFGVGHGLFAGWAESLGMPGARAAVTDTQREQLINVIAPCIKTLADPMVLAAGMIFAIYNPKRKEAIQWGIQTGKLNPDGTGKEDPKP